MRQGLSFVPCELCRDHLIGYIHHALDPNLMAQLKHHLANCRACRTDYQYLCAIEKIDISTLPPRFTNRPAPLCSANILPSANIRTVPDVLASIRTVAIGLESDLPGAEAAVLSLFEGFATDMLSFLGCMTGKSGYDVDSIHRELNVRSSVLREIIRDPVTVPFIPCLRRFSENLLNQGILLSLNDAQPNALACLHLAHMLMIILDDKPHQIKALRAIGETLFHEHRIQQAIGVFEQARTLADASNDYIESGLCLRDLGSALFHSGQIDASLRTLEAALDLSSKNPDMNQQVQDLNNLACVYFHNGNLKKSIEYSETALLRFHRSEQTSLFAQLMANSGAFLAEAGDIKTAEIRWNNALKAFSELNMQLDRCLLHRNIALLQYRIGSFDSALAHINNALESSAITPEIRLFCLLLRGRLHRQCGRYELAVQDHDIAQSVARQLGDAQWLRIARIESAIDDAHCQHSISAFQTLKNLKVFGRRSEPVSVFYIENCIDAARIAINMKDSDLAKSMKAKAGRAARTLRSRTYSYSDAGQHPAEYRIQQILDSLPNI